MLYAVARIAVDFLFGALELVSVRWQLVLVRGGDYPGALGVVGWLSVHGRSPFCFYLYFISPVTTSQPFARREFLDVLF